MKRRVQSRRSIPGVAPSWAQAELRRYKFHHDPVETSHFELVETTSSANTIGCDVVSYSNESIYVESLPSRALPGYHVQFCICFHAIDGVDSKMLFQYCLRNLRITATLGTIRDDDSLVYLHPVFDARSDGVPGVCVSFAPQWDASDVNSSYITICSITLAGKPVSAHRLPATLHVGVNHAPSQGTRLLYAAQKGSAEDAYATLCDGCSTAEEAEFEFVMNLRG